MLHELSSFPRDGSADLAVRPLPPRATVPLDRSGGGGSPATRAWRARYVRRIVLGDAICAGVAGAGGYFVRFGTEGASASAASVWVAGTLPLVWVLAMLVARSYEERFLWAGPEEFQRMFFAAVLLLAAVGTVSWAFRLEVARGFVVIALPLATGLTLVGRYAQRQAVHRARLRGRYQLRTLLVGHRTAVDALDAQMRRAAYHGYRVIGSCVPIGQVERPPGTVGPPVLGGMTDVARIVVGHEVDTVAVLPCPELDGTALRRLGWALEKTGAELLLAPAVTEIVGTRVRIRPVCGLPLMHMERPELTGVRRLTKELFDRTAAVLGLLLLGPALVAIAVTIKVTSRGPVFFRQQRVGRDGRTFTMLKFRSMVTGADRMVEALGTDHDGNDVLYKKRDDPRVTPVGRFLRRHSFDELPQLLNVVRGEMSLVGPRPPLPAEVERYGFDMHRRFLVKPGLTGLWQVSGRSDLSWDESVRIDVRYVENWSLTFDFMILWKTVGAVLRGRGAY